MSMKCPSSQMEVMSPLSHTYSNNSVLSSTHFHPCTDISAELSIIKPNQTLVHSQCGIRSVIFPYMVIRVDCVHSIGLLEVLMGPHVISDSGRESIVGQLLCALSWGEKRRENYQFEENNYLLRNGTTAAIMSFANRRGEVMFSYRIWGHPEY